MDKNELMGKRVLVTQQFSRDGWPEKVYTPVNVERGVGWVVGFRTIQNGEIEHEYDEYGMGETSWVPSSYIKCVLVSMTPYQNPIKVPLGGFEVIE